jgi:hypothetical protein
VKPSEPNRPQLPSAIRFNSSGAVSAIKIDLVIQKLGLFRADFADIRAREYAFATAVPREVFATFVRMVQDGPSVITQRDCGALSDLSHEFEFVELSAACEDLSRSRLPVARFRSLSIVERLL